MSVPLSMRLVTPPHVHTRRLDEELVLLNMENECYFGLDEESTHMWDVLLNATSIQAGVNQLLDEYEVDAEQLRADIGSFLSKLVENGLVELQPA